MGSLIQKVLGFFTSRNVKTLHVDLPWFRGSIEVAPAVATIAERLDDAFDLPGVEGSAEREAFKAGVAFAIENAVLGLTVLDGFTAE